MCRRAELGLEAANPSLFNRIDPRVKIISGLVFAATIVSLSSLKLLFIGLGFSLTALVLARVTFRQVLARLIPALPFLLPVLFVLPLVTTGETIFRVGPLSMSAEGVNQALIISIRIVTVISVFTAITATSTRSQILIALGQLGVPSIFIQIAEFSLRYVTVLSNEIKTMLTAKQCRGYEPSGIFSLRNVQELGSIIGMLFIRSYDRANRVYIAMLSRGYAADLVRTGHFSISKFDLAASTVMCLLSASLLVLDKGGLSLWLS